MNDGELLQKIGRALYGENFRSQLGELLGVNERTLRRWTAFEAPVPNGLWSELHEQLENRSSLLNDLARATEKRLGRVDVYSFTYWNHERGVNERSHGKSTLARIERLGFTPDHSTRESVDGGEVDGEGRLIRLIERRAVRDGFQTQVTEPRTGRLE